MDLHLSCGLALSSSLFMACLTAACDIHASVKPYCTKVAVFLELAAQLIICLCGSLSLNALIRVDLCVPLERRILQTNVNEVSAHPES